MSSGDVVKTETKCAKPHESDKNVHLLRRADGTLFCPVHGDAPPLPEVGTTWRSELGGHPMTVVAVDDRFAYMKAAKSSKKALANPAGGYPSALGEFARGEWIPV